MSGVSEKTRTKEEWVKVQVKRMLRELDLWFYMPAAAIYGRAGASDFLLCVHGRFLAIEAKRDEKEKPTKLQMDFLKSVLAAGGDTFIVHSGNLDVFRAWLTNHMGVSTCLTR
jgi:hypothetical protein